MLRVVLDTNVVVSGLMSTNGNPAKILNLVASRNLKVYYSPEIFAEYIDVLARPHFKFSSEDRSSFQQGVEQFGVLSQPPSSSIPLPDEDDRCFYDVAKYCEAILITGNIQHYPVEPFIVTPTEFLILVGM